MVRGYLLFISATFCVFLIGNVAGLESENIIGGVRARIENNNYVVSVQDDEDHLCSGTLIEDDMVLTAAHCFLEEKIKNSYVYVDEPYFVIAGTVDVQNFDHRIRVDKVYLHTKYEVVENVLNDIAVLKLQKKFNVINSPNIGVAHLPKKDEYYVGKTAKVLGFGADAVKYLGNEIWEASNYPGILKQATVKIARQPKCDKKMHQGLLCGMTQKLKNQGTQGVCNGDSGGPLMLKDTVIGIVSISLGKCDDTSTPATYTKVSKYLDFIKNVKHGLASKYILIKSVRP